MCANNPHGQGLFFYSKVIDSDVTSELTFNYPRRIMEAAF